ncbi:hypothetical protein MBBWO_12940 [Methanobrevibacter woesei]|uniref:Uncharacterized protein n=1 Tax=Methanobrevibacter woesei TaxID=190976 RepID=A0A2U1S5R0_9EURY|nr:hypothetical protein MBBWO_12940 [Methanobrevibacter woesei]
MVFKSELRFKHRLFLGKIWVNMDPRVSINIKLENCEKANLILNLYFGDYIF